jgi:hypothetical protein
MLAPRDEVTYFDWVSAQLMIVFKEKILDTNLLS